eukprot:TRINITY_DN55651_c0_g1_i1.p1 TRINITY_DN55651_c0_g1~~TRINITY_DN55651_c0_g1_i1.p1  ORF type:complete len:541 (+),score=61.80 TRINITY_DN55651_c0_g1_i1:64-1623(+)
MSGGLTKHPPRQVKGYDIFIRNLKQDTTPEELAGFFGEAGKILGKPRLQPERGFAWITFATPAAVTEAISWSGCYFGSRIMYVDAAKSFQAAAKTLPAGIRSSNEDFGSHFPALCEDTIQKMVAPDPGGIYVDGTFGRGGHCKAILAALSPSGRLHAFDLDPEAVKVGKELMAKDSRFTIHHAPFSSMRKTLKSHGVAPGSVSGVLMDLGISSPQFDDTGRGFRPEADGALDLRFDISKGVPASEFLMTVPHSELVRIISEYGEVSATGEHHAARRIADAICLARSRGNLPTTTKAFAALVAQAKGKEASGQAMHPAKMTFQALRIHLNDEFDEARKGMRAAFEILSEGGRIALITWKFSERDIVDEVFRSLEAVKDNEPLFEWYKAQPDYSPLPDGPSLQSDEVIRPSERELQRNSRSRAALLHVLYKRSLPRLAHLEERAYALPGWGQVVAPVGLPKSDVEVKAKKVKRKKKQVATTTEDEVPAEKVEMKKRKRNEVPAQSDEPQKLSKKRKRLEKL